MSLSLRVYMVLRQTMLDGKLVWVRSGGDIPVSFSDEVLEYCLNLCSAQGWETLSIEPDRIILTKTLLGIEAKVRAGVFTSETIGRSFRRSILMNTSTPLSWTLRPVLRSWVNHGIRTKGGGIIG
jgi:hypothetical protein